MNVTVEERRSKDIRKLYPYLNCQKNSPKKQKEIMSFLQQKLLKIERSEHNRKLKRIKMEKNSVQEDHPY